MQLKHKVTVITGAKGGIGKVMADTYASYGSDLVLVDIQPELSDLAATIEKKHGVRARSYQVDISKSDAVHEFIQVALTDFSRIDILINNAGILRDATLLKMTEESFDQVIAVNLRGVFLCGQACARIMVEQKYGKIVNISSVASRGNFGQTNYSATKAGVIGMTKTWALELSKYNINVNAIAPGLISTEMTQSIPNNVREAMISKVPLKRMGEPQDVAELACFLSSDESSYIQGEVIHLNGGLLM